MSRKKDTKIHNIFCVDSSKVELKYFASQPQTTDAIIDKLIKESNKYKVQKIKENLHIDPFNIRLFFYSKKQNNSELSTFCESFVAEGQKILSFRSTTASSILFLWSDKHIYAVTTGQGFRVVEEFCVPKFGMQVASIFINAFRITALDSNGMASIVHSTKTIYSNEVDFIDIDNLDTVFKEVTGRLLDKSTVHTLLQLDDKSKKNSMKITAKNYVQFSSAVNFKGLLFILNYIDQYDFAQLSDKFNLILPLNTKRNQKQIDHNNVCVYRQIYKAIINDQPIGFDLFHRETNEFISAESYKICHTDDSELATTDDIQPGHFVKEAYKTYIKNGEDSFDTFCVFFKDVKLNAIKDEIVITSDTLMKHISGEISIDDKNYYIFYGYYYYLNTGYSERLEQTLKGKLRPDVFSHMFRTKWNPGDIEDTFNENASINEDYIHLHKVKPELVEFADLLKMDNNLATIVHVKDGFDGSMRELERQIELSMTRMIDLQNNNNETYLRKLYQNAVAHTVGKNIQTIFQTEDDFIQRMRQCVYCYVMVLHVDNKDLLSARSNIAKHCLNSLFLKCFNHGIELKIELV